MIQEIVDQPIVTEDLRAEKRSEDTSFVMKIDQERATLE
jgi:hypothetical protein